MEPFANHFDFRHAVDDSNNLRHSTPSFEETWVTRQWPIRVFSFFLALSEVNTFCAYRYFVWKTDEEQLILHQFCRKLALDFINNAYISQGGVDGDGDGRRKRNRSYVCHALKTAPPHAKRWTGKKWNVSATARYQQYVCCGENCKLAIRTYCDCDPGLWMCGVCHVDHCLIVSENGDM